MNVPTFNFNWTCFFCCCSTLCTQLLLVLHSNYVHVLLTQPYYVHTLLQKCILAGTGLEKPGLSSRISSSALEKATSYVAFAWKIQWVFCLFNQACFKLVHFYFLFLL